MDSRKKQLLKSIEKAEKLAKSGKLSRFWNHPTRYIYLQLINKILYPLLQKGVKAHAYIPHIQAMEVILPAGSDLYLLGFKSHDSEIRLSKFLVKNMTEKDTFLDVGAHFGYYAILCAGLTNSKIVAIEPSIKTYETLVKNVNHSKNKIETENFAASNKDGSIEFYDYPIKFNEYNSHKKPAPEKQKLNPVKNTVKSKSLSGWLEEKAFKPNYIKIDVEGSEAEVVEGLMDYLKREESVVIIEYFPENHASFYPQIWSKLAELKYECNYIDDHGNAVPLKDSESHFNNYKHLSDNLVFKKII